MPWWSQTRSIESSPHHDYIQNRNTQLQSLELNTAAHNITKFSYRFQERRNIHAKLLFHGGTIFLFSTFIIHTRKHPRHKQFFAPYMCKDALTGRGSRNFWFYYQIQITSGKAGTFGRSLHHLIQAQVHYAHLSSALESAFCRLVEAAGKGNFTAMLLQ